MFKFLNHRSVISAFTQYTLIALLLLVVGCGGGAVQDAPAGLAQEDSSTNTAPSISVLSPNNGGNQMENESTSLTASASDQEDGDISDNISWSSNIDGDLGIGSSIIVNLSPGTHVISALISDSGDLTNSDSVNFSINSSNSAPSISIISPSDGANQDVNSTTTLTATANDQEDGNLDSIIQWSSSIDGDLGVGSSIVIQLTAGTHSISAAVVDSGNLSSAISISYQVTTTDTLPSVAITAPSDGGNQPEGQTTLLTASASDSEDGNLNNNIEWNSDLDGVLGTGNSLSVQLSSGEHVITASVTDSSNQTAQDSVTHSLVASYGVATLSWTAPTENTDDTLLSDLAGFKIYYGTEQGSLTQTITIQDSLTVSQVVQNLVINTTYYFAVVAFNDMGIESDLSETVSKLIGS